MWNSQCPLSLSVINLRVLKEMADLKEEHQRLRDELSERFVFSVGTVFRIPFMHVVVIVAVLEMERNHPELHRTRKKE